MDQEDLKKCPQCGSTDMSLDLKVYASGISGGVICRNCGSRLTLEEMRESGGCESSPAETPQASSTEKKWWQVWK